jgi:hypothetical protein
MNSLLSGFSSRGNSVGLRLTGKPMFVFNRSLAAVLLPLALLLAVVFWSNAGDLAPAKPTQIAATKPVAQDHSPEPLTLTASNQRSVADR